MTAFGRFWWSWLHILLCESVLTRRLCGCCGLQWQCYIHQCWTDNIQSKYCHHCITITAKSALILSISFLSRYSLLLIDCTFDNRNLKSVSFLFWSTMFIWIRFLGFTDLFGWPVVFLPPLCPLFFLLFSLSCRTNAHICGLSRRKLWLWYTRSLNVYSACTEYCSMVVPVEWLHGFGSVQYCLQSVK